MKKQTFKAEIQAKGYVAVCRQATGSIKINISFDQIGTPNIA